MNVAQHHDVLQALNADGPLRARIREIHWAVRSFLPFVARVAVALYDPKTTHLRAFVHSGQGDEPVSHAQVPIGEVPSLRRLLDEGRPRVIEHMLTFENEESEHARRLGRSGYAASYTMPMFSEGVFLGFVFFNSREADVFTDGALSQLDIFGHLVCLLVVQEIATLRALSAALEGTGQVTRAADSETGSHLDRMSRYAGLIARALAERHGLDDAWISRLQSYAPLHDIGKIGLPESILLKPDGLTQAEMDVVKTHVNRGQALIDDLLTRFGMDTLADTDMIRNIALFHHERVDGKGYPYGLASDAIPLEARIVAAADVFDALTSRRPWKEAYANDMAFGMLGGLAGTHLDAECVRALVDDPEGVGKIQATWREDTIG
jgi:HD-GYP domain-containing protein (c-di-GMP phosphodiesterase class II)